MNPKQGFQEDGPVKTPDADKIITVEIKTPMTLDGQLLPAGMTVKISIKQWRALSRHFTYIDGPKEHAPKGWKAAAAAAIAFLLCLFSFNAQAVGPPSQFGDLPLPPMIALLPTNGAPAVVNVASDVTNTWTALTNSAGIPTNIIAVTRFDELYLTLTSSNAAGSGGITNTYVFWGGNGKGIWDTNHPVFVLTNSVASGNTAVLCTNISRNLFGSCGYFVCGTMGATSASQSTTNNTLEIQVKPIRAGN